MNPCDVRDSCPKGYTQVELRELAKKCGINVTRSGTAGRGYKTMDELCAEMLQKKKGSIPKRTGKALPMDTELLITSAEIDELDNRKYRDLANLQEFLERHPLQAGTVQAKKLKRLLKDYTNQVSEVRRSLVQNIYFELVPDSFSSAEESVEYKYDYSSDDDTFSSAEEEQSLEEENTEYESSSEEEVAAKRSFKLREQKPKPKIQYNILPSWDDVHELDFKDYNDKERLNQFLAPFLPLIKSAGKEDELNEYLHERNGDYRREQTQTLLASFVQENVSSEEEEEGDVSFEVGQELYPEMEVASEEEEESVFSEADTSLDESVFSEPEEEMEDTEEEYLSEEVRSEEDIMEELEEQLASVRIEDEDMEELETQLASMTIEDLSFGDEEF